MKVFLSIFVLATLIVANNTYAHCMQNKYYVGGGLNINSQSQYGETSGYQVLGGYCLDFNFKSPRSKTSVELGYLSTGEFERQYDIPPRNRNQPGRTITERETLSGVWFSGLAEYKFESKLHLMARLGYDIGDDNGIFAGGGVGYNFTKWAQVRAEYVSRNETDSVQFNWISEF